MTWVKVDDGLFLNPKIGRASLEALGVYVLSLAYCAHNLTDGEIPVTALHLLRCTDEIAMELDAIGLWEDHADDGFTVHDYLKYNPSRRKVLQERKKTRERVTRYRTGPKRKRNAVTTDAPVPVPVPLKESSKEDSLSRGNENGQRPEVLGLCQLLADQIAANGSKRPNPQQHSWLAACRLMLDRDERPVDEAERVIRWCQQDEFWKANVMSMPTLRRQYDQLRIKAGVRPKEKRERRYTHIANPS